jgi:hypothetical protein
MRQKTNLKRILGHGKATDNRISNLQLLTRRDNTAKSVMKHGKLTGAFRNGNKWIARISKSNKIVNLGNFNTQEEAHNKYVEYKSKL